MRLPQSSCSEYSFILHLHPDLTFTDHKPKFLANIDSALRGTQPTTTSQRRTDINGDTTEILDPNRPAIPVRPDASDDEEPQIVDIQDDGRDAGLGRLTDQDDDDDDEAPQVVVLKEGKHLTSEQVQAEKIRRQYTSFFLFLRTVCTHLHNPKINSRSLFLENSSR